MTQQVVEHCSACEGEVDLLSEQMINNKLSQLDNWHYDQDKYCLTKTVIFKGFNKTMSFVNAVAWIANVEKHHPDMEVSFNQCVIHFQTHAAGGVTENDFICAKKVDALLL